MLCLPADMTACRDSCQVGAMTAYILTREQQFSAGNSELAATDVAQLTQMLAGTETGCNVLLAEES